jgi:hypothetical protein
MTRQFSPHIQKAHSMWNTFLQEKDSVIDATAGNGHDSLFLGRKILPYGHLFLFDIQEKALRETKLLLEKNLPSDNLQNVHYIPDSHVYLKNHIKNHPIRLIVYNLGYLPGGDKSIVTQTNSTLLSIDEALEIVSSTVGAISITCYPGHEEGEKEESAILRRLATLSSKDWLIEHHRWINRPKSPSWIWVQKL